MTPASVAAMVWMSVSLFFTWASSCAMTPSSSCLLSSSSMPCVHATAACAGFLPVANALGLVVGMM